MGFTTGFIGGLTATYTLLYMSLHLHRSNRLHQSLLLKQNRYLLTSIYAPETFEVLELEPAYEVRQAGITEELKDRWNRELSAAIRNLQDTDWEAVRIRWERRAGNLWENLRRTDMGQRFSENVVGQAEDVKEGAKEAAAAATTTGKRTGEKRLLELK